MAQPPKIVKKHWLTAKRVTALVVVLIAALFIGQNRQLVDINLFVTTVSGPMWAALTGMVVFGVLIGLLLAKRRH
jgi:uncharacterized integral membrane protein